MWMKFTMGDGSMAEVWYEKDGCEWIIIPEDGVVLAEDEYRWIEQELSADEVDAAEARVG